MAVSIPVIDLGGAEADAARAIDQACRDIGFFAITGHGVDMELVARLRAVAEDFFARPVAEKLKLARPSQEISRGYNRLADQAHARSLGGVAPPDLQESLGFGPDDRVPPKDAGADPEILRIFHAPNLWPRDAGGMRSAVEAYQREMRALGDRLMRLAAIGLGLGPDYFARYFEYPSGNLRLNHYPAQADAPMEGQLRCGAHTDYGALTILWGDDVPGGLEVDAARAGWIPAAAPSGGFMINIGDLLQYVTGGRWVSTLHRVMNPPPQAARQNRHSFAFFYQPTAHVPIPVIPGGPLGDGGQALTAAQNWMNKTRLAREGIAQPAA